MGDADFEDAYYRACEADADATDLGRVLLVDDVCTEGSALSAATSRLRDADPECEVGAATAGQMVVKDAVADEQPLLDPAAV